MQVLARSDARIAEIVQEKPDARVNMATLFGELRKPPYGVRDGIIPLLLSVFAISHDKMWLSIRMVRFLRELNGEADAGADQSARTLRYPVLQD